MPFLVKPPAAFRTGRARTRHQQPALPPAPRIGRLTVTLYR